MAEPMPSRRNRTDGAPESNATDVGRLTQTNLMARPHLGAMSTSDDGQVDHVGERLRPSRPPSNGSCTNVDANETDSTTRAERNDEPKPALVREGIPGLTGHRDDVQGLRAVAVLLVVLGHAGVGFLKGGYVGVDVFFVLSGFLITGILLSRAAKTGHVSLTDFYVRRARRILPAAALTLVVTDIAAYYLLNFVRAREAVTDSIWAAFFGANIQFARQGTDYFAQGQPPSPIQHFWSLAVEEQFYLVWPALLSLVLFGAIFGFRRHHRGGAQAITQGALWRLLVVIVLVGLGSLAWSIHSTSLTPASAYFSTFARAWELALGAALAIAAPNLRRLPAGVTAAAGWLGLACIACAAVLYSESTRFPGYAALLPTVGAALVIGAGIRKRQPRFGAGRVLSLAPLCYVGDRSYAYYLWHWSVLVIAVQYVGHDLSVGVKLLLMFGAFVLSIFSYALFENPIRHMRWRAPVGALLWPASVAAVLVVAFVTLGSIDDKTGRIEAASAAVKPTPLADPLAEDAAKSGTTALPAVQRAVRAAQRGAPLPSPLTPPVSQLLKDVYDFPSECVPHEGQTSSKICSMGDTESVKTLVVMGDSFMQMWMPTILRMAEQDGWLVRPIVKSACTPGSWVRYPQKPECPAWYRWATKQAKALRPDAFLVAGDWGPETPVDTAVKVIGTLTTTMRRFSKSVIVLGLPPEQKRQPVDCLLAQGATMKTCTPRITKTDLSGDIRISAAATKQHVGFMNSRGWFCARTSTKKLVYLCPLVVNRTITHRDRGHITTTYGLELFNPFRGAFRRALFQ
jgi:peptidoglycan/LPS O-acetylase OafA/YrhL